MARTPKTQSEKATLAARRAWCYLVLVLISFLCLFFFYVLVINSTRTHFEIQKGFSLLPGKSLVTNFRNVLADANIPVGTGIRNSLIISACSAALSVYFSALTAYGIYAYNFRFKKAAFAIILLIMTMPTQVSALGFLQLITKMGLKNSFVPLILPSIAAPTVFFFMKQYLDASLPMEIVEAARIDGAGEFYTFNKIVLPIMKPALAVQAIFSFVASWNNYFIPALVLDSADKKTLPILIAQLRSADFLKFDMGKVYMMVAIAILPVIIVYLLLSKFIVRGVALGGVKGYSTSDRKRAPAGWQGPFCCVQELFKVSDTPQDTGNGSIRQGEKRRKDKAHTHSVGGAQGKAIYSPRTAAKPASRSAMMSSMCSVPMDRRMVFW